MKILIVEDEASIAEVVKAYCVREGYEAAVAEDGEQAVEMFRTENPDLVVLDLMLPKMSGEKVCATIRETSNVPIIMLTAKGTESDVIAGLDAGADDYVIKPFSPRVLMARIRANLRHDTEKENLSVKKTISFSGVEIDLNRLEIRKDGTPIPVTRNEFLIFQALAEKPNKTFSRDELIFSAFGEEYDGFDRTVDTYIKNLRRKLADERHSNGYIKTVYGFGYRIDMED